MSFSVPGGAAAAALAAKARGAERLLNAEEEVQRGAISAEAGWAAAQLAAAVRLPDVCVGGREAELEADLAAARAHAAALTDALHHSGAELRGEAERAARAEAAAASAAEELAVARARAASAGGAAEAAAARRCNALEAALDAAVSARREAERRLAQAEEQAAAACSAQRRAAEDLRAEAEGAAPRRNAQRELLAVLFAANERAERQRIAEAEAGRREARALLLRCRAGVSSAGEGQRAAERLALAAEERAGRAAVEQQFGAALLDMAPCPPPPQPEPQQQRRPRARRQERWAAAAAALRRAAQCAHAARRFAAWQRMAAQRRRPAPAARSPQQRAEVAALVSQVGMLRELVGLEQNKADELRRALDGIAQQRDGLSGCVAGLRKYALETGRLRLGQQEAEHRARLAADSGCELALRLCRAAPPRLAQAHEGGWLLASLSPSPGGSWRVADWRQYYVWVDRVRGLLLLSAGAPAEGAARGSISVRLAEIQSVEVELFGDPALPPPPVGRYQQLGFRVETPGGGRHRFCAATVGERSAWLSALRLAVSAAAQQQPLYRSAAQSPPRAPASPSVRLRPGLPTPRHNIGPPMGAPPAPDAAMSAEHRSYLST